MKKILVLFFCCNSILSYGQNDYTPLPTENAVWSSLSYYGGQYKITTQYGIYEDTIIGDNIYHKIYSSRDSIWNIINDDIQYIGCFREDNKKILHIKEGDDLDEEELVMDFNLSVGDTISYKLDIPGPIHLVEYIGMIDSIDLLNGDQRLRFRIDKSERPEFLDTTYISESRDIWIEGIGSDLPFHFSGFDLLCFYENGMQLFDNEEYDYCYIDEMISPIITLDNDFKFEVFPSPFDESLNINLNKIYKNIRVNFFDLSGKLIREDSIRNVSKIELNVNTLSTGLYILSINADGNIFSKKITKF